MTNTKELVEQELEKVSGGFGEKTGDMKDGKVYIKFPLIAASFSGYYDCDGLEKLATQYASYAALIKNYVDNDIRTAVTKLYSYHNRTIPDTVKNLLGM